jgi:hypothetical protein
MEAFSSYYKLSELKGLSFKSSRIYIRPRPKRKPLEKRIPPLPLDILCIIASFLGPSDLKNARLSCSQLFHASEGLLFRQVYLSCHSSDIKVFQNITTNPNLSRQIEEIIYDVSIFNPRHFPDYGSFAGDLESRFKFDNFLWELKLPTYQSPISSTLIKFIYDFWFDQMIEYTSNLQESLDMTALKTALPHLPRLKKVKLTRVSLSGHPRCHRWTWRGNEAKISSPMYRQWLETKHNFINEWGQFLQKSFGSSDQLYNCYEVLFKCLRPLIPYEDDYVNGQHNNRPTVVQTPECQQLAELCQSDPRRAFTCLLATLSDAAKHNSALYNLWLSYSSGSNTYYLGPDHQDLYGILRSPERYQALFQSLRVLKLSSESRSLNLLSKFLSQMTSVVELALKLNYSNAFEVLDDGDKIFPKLEILKISDSKICVPSFLRFLERHRFESSGVLRAVFILDCLADIAEAWPKLVESLRLNRGFGVKYYEIDTMKSLHVPTNLWDEDCWDYLKYSQNPHDLIAHIISDREFPIVKGHSW